MWSAASKASFARSVIPSGLPGPRPTALSWPGSASKSSIVAPTSCSLLPGSSVFDAPHELDDVFASEPPHFDPLESAVSVEEAPHFELELEESVPVSALEAPQLAVDSSPSSAFGSVLMDSCLSWSEIVDVTT